MSKLESAMETLIEVFKYYASKDCTKFKLSKGELKNLLRGELNHYLETTRDCKQVEHILHDLDQNCDSSVNFEEYMALVTKITVSSSKQFEGCTPCGH